MRKRLLGPVGLARANRGCEDHGDGEGNARECTRAGRDKISTMDRVVNRKREAPIAPTPTLLAIMEDRTPNGGHDVTPTISPHTRTTSSLSTTLDHDSSTPKLRARSESSSVGTTILTISTAATPSSLIAASTRTFVPTGAQTTVPTYPPNSSSRQTTTQTSLATKLGLGFGIPVAVLLTILLTTLLHRKYRRRRRNNTNIAPPPPAKTYHYQQHQPEMASTNRAFLYPRMHRTTTTSSIISASTTSNSSSANIVITPAPGVMTPHTPYHALSPAPRIPRRSSARPPPRPRRSTVLSGPLDSHPSAVRAVSSIYEDGDDNANSYPSQQDQDLGGNGVGDVLAEYLDFSPRHLYGPWDPGQPHSSDGSGEGFIMPRSDDGSAEGFMMPRPLEPAARRQREYLAVDVEQHQHGSAGSMGDDVSPMSTSSSGREYLPTRISAMSGLSPASPERTRTWSRRRI